MLNYDIDWTGLARVANDLQATDKQVKLALSRALRRTEATLRRMSSKGLRQELELRTAAALRKRLKSIKLKKTGGLGNSDGVTLWYGLNDLPVSSFKGRPKSTAKGAEFKGNDYDGAFVGRSKVKGKQTIFRRKGKARLSITEQLVPIEDKAITYIEDEIFDKVEGIFWQHFRRDLASRVRYQIGGL